MFEIFKKLFEKKQEENTDKSYTVEYGYRLSEEETQVFLIERNTTDDKKI